MTARVSLKASGVRDPENRKDDKEELEVRYNDRKSPATSILQMLIVACEDRTQTARLVHAKVRGFSGGHFGQLEGGGFASPLVSALCVSNQANRLPRS